MAKAKKRVAERKKSSKRGKASAKPARKIAAKHVTLKKAKSKVRRVGLSAKKAAAKKKAPGEAAEGKQVAQTPVETTVINVIEKPAPGAIAVTEYETVQMATSISSEGEPERHEGAGPAGAPT
jgi:hypothetical protein